MNVVFALVNIGTAHGGIRVIIEQANRLQARGHTVEIWTLLPPDNDLSFACKVPIRLIRSEYDNEKQRLIEFKDLVSPERIDVYIAGSFSVVFGFGAFPNARCFWYLQGDEESLVATSKTSPSGAASTVKEALKLPITKFCSSGWVRTLFKNRHGIDMPVITPGIDTDLFRPDIPLLEAAQRPTVMAIYSPVPWKGLGDLFLALALLDSKGISCRLLLVAMSDTGLPEEHGRLEIVLNPEQRLLRRLYSSADVFVSTSLSEGFGLPGLEAMACGIPLVTTDSGGTREYTRLEDNSLVVPPADPAHIADAIKRILEDTTLRERLRRNGPATAREFDWDTKIDELERLINATAD